MDPLLVSIGGAFGAIFRYGVGQLLANRSFPWATLGVNAIGSFVLGLVLFSGIDSDLVGLIGIGFCGAFTTFSSFSFQTVELWNQGDRLPAVLNATGNLMLSLAAFLVAAHLVG